MSLAAVRPFFRTRMNSLGFSEHTDAFDDTNRAQKKLDKLYRIEVGGVSGSVANSQVHQFDIDVSLVITLHGVGAKNVALADRSMQVAQDVLAEILANRTNADIKDIIPGAITITPYSASDDNDLILNMDFTCIIYCEFI